MRQTLLLMLGFPGTGKTTVAKIICEQTGAEHIWADDERREMFERPAHSPGENRKLYDRLNKKVEGFLADGKSVAFDSNFNFYKDREKMCRLAIKYGAQTIVVWVTTPIEIARARAVEQSDEKETRLWGNMLPENFDRMSRNLQPPRDDERVIKLDGSNLNKQDISKILQRLTE